MRTLRLAHAVLALAIVPLVTAGAEAGSPAGIGILGDSYSDEYQFYGPDRSTARNWVEVLAEMRGLDFGRFSTEGRGEPRNQGFEYNWARSDATTEDLIATGQHTGLAAQVAAGDVGIVVIFIGGNDFIHALEGPAPDEALDRVLPRALANYRRAVETIVAAGRDVKVVLATVPDIRDLPEFARPLRAGRLSPVLADRFSAALKTFNAQVRSLAFGRPRVALVDFDLLARAANYASREHALVAGRRLDRSATGNDLDHLFLNDDRHIGTVGQGLMAQMIVNAINTKFGAGIAPIDDREIISYAQTRAMPAPFRAWAGLDSKSKPLSLTRGTVVSAP